MARGLQAATGLQRSPRSPLHPATPLLHRRVLAVHQRRALWWWGRQRTDWTPHHDECLEERLRIHQRLLRHRSSKMLRRRAMWEREAMAPASCWPWRMPSRLLGRQLQIIQNLSSTTAGRSKVEEHSDGSAQHRPAATFHRDFESFKKAVDEAVQKDPYGALFGRRLQGPDSVNNSSWTSFSRIWDPKDIKQDESDSQEPASQPPKSSAAPSPSPSPSKETTSSPVAGSTPSKQSEAEEEYEYDPISMRRIPKSKRHKFLSLFFHEHDLDLTPKIYEPKVYGYVDKSKDSKSSKSSKSAVNLESSRHRRIREMRAATLGNTIATSAEFGGKFDPPEDPSPEPPRRKPREECDEPSDDTPPFSGTTYEGKSAEILASRRAGGQSNTSPSEPLTPELEDGVSSKALGSRIQTSLDRLMPKTDQASVSILQPALDRHLQTRENEKTQSLSVRHTLHEPVEDAPYKFSSKLDNIWKHVENHPDGVVAKTIKSLGLQHSPARHITSEDRGKANLHKDIVEGARRTLTGNDEAAGLTKDPNKIDDGILNQQSLNVSPSLHPLKTATVKPGVPRYPAIEAHVSDFEPRFAKLVYDAKDVKRQIHEARISYRQLKQQLLASPRSDGDQAAASPSFSMLKEDPVEEPYAQSLDGPFISADTSVYTTPDLASEPSYPDAAFTPTATSVSDAESLSAPYVVLRYNSGKDIVHLQSLSEPLPNDSAGLSSFDRLDHAAKFFSFFPLLLKQGYEVTSGGQDYVLFKRTGANVDQVAESTEASSPSETVPLSAPTRLVQPPMPPAAAARLKEHQELTSAYIGLNDVKYSHSLNNFEVHSVLSKLAASVRKGKQEGAEGLGGVLERLKVLRSKARTMDPAEFNKQADELIREVQIARSAVPVKQVTPAAPISSEGTDPGEEAQNMYTATVLDEIPSSIPTPGPATPTAPPSGSPAGGPVLIRNEAERKTSLGQEKQSPSSEAYRTPLEGDGHVSEQQQRLPPSGFGPRVRPLDRFDRGEQPPKQEEFEPEEAYQGSVPKLGLFRRLARLARKATLTIIGAGVGAYTIGMIAESVGAEAQKANAGDQGPRKKVVLPPPPPVPAASPPSSPPGHRQRPGIFSTESSR